jgi:NAD(P)H dehydrogenase (quinone)
MTILSSLAPLIHLGMVFVGVRYSTNPQIMTTEGVGGALRPLDDAREESDVEAPTPEEIETARSLGRRVTRVAARLQAPAVDGAEAPTPA